MTSTPDATLLVRLSKCGVYRTSSPDRRSWLIRLMANWPSVAVVSVVVTSGEPRIGRPSAPTPKVGRPAVPAVISSPASTSSPFGADSASFEKPAQTSPLIAAMTRWASNDRLSAWLLTRSRPVTRPLDSDSSKTIEGLDWSTSTRFTAWLPMLVVIRPQSWSTPGASGSRPAETYGPTTAADAIEGRSSERRAPETISSARAIVGAARGLGSFGKRALGRNAGTLGDGPEPGRLLPVSLPHPPDRVRQRPAAPPSRTGARASSRSSRR